MRCGTVEHGMWNPHFPFPILLKFDGIADLAKLAIPDVQPSNNPTFQLSDIYANYPCLYGVSYYLHCGNIKFMNKSAEISPILYTRLL